MQKVLTLGMSITLVALACSPAPNKIDEAPTAAVYELRFSSSQVIADADTIQVQVFDTNVPGNDCTGLVQKRRSRQELPPRLEGCPEGTGDARCETEPVSPCVLLQASGGGIDGGKKEGLLTRVPYGKRSFLAVGQRKGRDYLIGCGEGEVGNGTAPVAIDLSLFDGTVAAPTNNCAQLSQKCSNPPTCQVQ
jgi:hypothetical protein